MRGLDTNLKKIKLDDFGIFEFNMENLLNFEKFGFLNLIWVDITPWCKNFP